MHPSTPEKKLSPAFSLNQHRRRVSLPTTPPETPLDGYFGNDARKSVSLASGDSLANSIFPASPPPTPTRALPEKEQTLLPPPSGHRSRPSRAYAHHRRTSTATLLRLAVARQGIILTPSKAITLFLIIFSATYLASFLPGPLSWILPRPSLRVQPVTYAHPSSAVYVHNNLPARGSQIGDAAQRREWSQSFPFRIPPQQHVVPVNEAGEAAEPEASSLDGDLMRAHPELLHNQERPARRRPLRLPKEAPVVNVGGIVPPSRPSTDDSFDDASRSPRQPHQDKGRKAQLQRMKKVAAAKGQNARVVKHVPVDSSELQAAARAEQERVIVDDGSSTGRRKLRSAKGVDAVVAAAAEERQVAQVAARQGRKHVEAVREVEKKGEAEVVAAPPSSRSSPVDEDWMGRDDADEGDE